MRRFLRMGAAVATLCCGGGVVAQTSPVPATNPGTWVTEDDFPIDALVANASGMVAMTLRVSSSGIVTDCTVTESSGSALLDETSCRLMRERGRFTPARAAGGQSIASFVGRRIRWRIPSNTVVALSPVATVIRLTLGENGKVIDCNTSSSRKDAKGPSVCQKRDGQYPGFADMNPSSLGPGTWTWSTVLSVDGIPFAPDPTTGAISDIPPYFTQIDRLTVDARGKVVGCERRSSSRDKIEPCTSEVMYDPTPDQPVRRAEKTFSMAFQPAK